MPNTEQSRTVPILLTVAAAALFATLFFVVRGLTHDSVRVRTAQVTLQTISDTASTNGKVEPVEEFQAHAPFPGVVQKIYVDVGDKVQAGRLLVSMDDTEARSRVASATANLVQAELTLSQMEQGGSTDERSQFSATEQSSRLEHQRAEQDLKTMEALAAKGAASAGEVKAAQDRLAAADLNLKTASTRATTRYSAADINFAKAHVEDCKAFLAAAKNALAQADIHAPIGGSVYSIPVSQYDFVPAGEDLMDIADLNRIQVRAYFDEPEIGKLSEGQPVKIVWGAKQGTAWHGHVLRAPTTVVPYGTRSVGECIISVDDTRGDLLPNTNVTVTVTERERKNVLSIPREALRTAGTNDYFVYRIVDGKLARTPVVAGIVNLTNAEIVSGLKEHDVVVLSSAVSGQELSNGLQVKPVQ
jgi:HlyD family secretion protein